MAKQDRGAGPGTYSKGGVRCTMDAPFSQGSNTGSQRNMSGTFDKPRSGGDNGLPTRVTDAMGGPSAGGTGPASQNSSPGRTATKRPGTQ